MGNCCLKWTEEGEYVDWDKIIEDHKNKVPVETPNQPIQSTPIQSTPIQNTSIPRKSLPPAPPIVPYVIPKNEFPLMRKNRYEFTSES